MKMNRSVTTRMNVGRRLAALVALALAGALAGCASLPPEAQVEARAQARWDALIGGKLEQAYTFLSPGSRALVSFERWRAGMGGMATWKGAKVFAVKCSHPDRCAVTIKVTYQPLLRRDSLGTIETSVEEVWLLDAGQWWLPLRQ